jgi:hypothetical protein
MLECAKKINTVMVKKQVLVDLLYDAAINNKYNIRRMLDCVVMPPANTNVAYKISMSKIPATTSPAFSRNIIKPKSHTNVKVQMLSRLIC